MSDPSPSWDEVRAYTEAAATHLNVWEGIPVPVPDQPLRLYPGHPLQAMFPPAVLASEEGQPILRIRNRWWSWERSGWVWVYEDAEGWHWHLERVAPDRSMDRLNLWLQTIGASIAWKYEAELEARAKLRSMLTPYAWRCYDLTGSFLERSQRSGVTYMFRRLRPTIALVPFKRLPGSELPPDDHMKVLAALCLHPIGYYEGSWAGAMVPTDDVIAHLVLMRGDERLFWRKANQHLLASAEAGL